MKFLRKRDVALVTCFVAFLLPFGIIYAWIDSGSDNDFESVKFNKCHVIDLQSAANLCGLDSIELI